MRTFKHAGITLTLLFSSLTLGSLLAATTSARADDLPIIVHKPIITKDPPKPPKGDSEVASSGVMYDGRQGQ